MRDSQVNLENSRSVRIISIVGMVFIPFSAISSIFGTQFFTPAGASSSSDNADAAATAKHMDVNPDFWILWAIAVPVTIIILVAWRATEHKSLALPLEVSRSLMAHWWPAARKGNGDDRNTPDGTPLQDIGPSAV